MANLDISFGEFQTGAILGAVSRMVDFDKADTQDQINLPDGDIYGWDEYDMDLEVLGRMLFEAVQYKFPSLSEEV